MAGPADVQCRRMVRRFLMARRAVVHRADRRVVHVGRRYQPVRRPVAGVTIFADGRDVRGGLTPGNDIVVATAATAIDLVVIHRLDRQPLIRESVVARITQV